MEFIQKGRSLELDHEIEALIGSIDGYITNEIRDLASIETSVTESRYREVMREAYDRTIDDIQKNL